MRDFYTRIVLIVVGVILLALGLLNIVPDILHFYYSNVASATLVIRNQWVLVAVCGAVLCIVGFFTNEKQD
jgi:hypothetical protein